VQAQGYVSEQEVLSRTGWTPTRISIALTVRACVPAAASLSRFASCPVLGVKVSMDSKLRACKLHMTSKVAVGCAQQHIQFNSCVSCCCTCIPGVCCPLAVGAIRLHHERGSCPVNPLQFLFQEHCGASAQHDVAGMLQAVALVLCWRPSV
jgi:hypothetical protein